MALKVVSNYMYGTVHLYLALAFTRKSREIARRTTRSVRVEPSSFSVETFGGEVVLTLLTSRI